MAFHIDKENNIYQDVYSRISFNREKKFGEKKFDFDKIIGIIWKKLTDLLYVIHWEKNVNPIALKLTEIYKKEHTSEVELFQMEPPCELSYSSRSNILEAINLSAMELR